MSNQHIDPSGHFGATRNFNNQVAKQVVKQALLLYPKTSPNDDEPIEAPITEQAESIRISSPKASAPGLDEVHLPPRQYAGEAQFMAAILDWQCDVRKELEADNLSAERTSSPSDNNYLPKLVTTQAVGPQPEPSPKEDEQAETAPAWRHNLCPRPQWRHRHPNWKKWPCPPYLRLCTNCPSLPCRSRRG